MNAVAPETRSEADRVLGYHERTKHRLDRYAAGPETLDWSAQPEPFREYRGSPVVSLPLDAARIGTSFDALHDAGAPVRPIDLSAVGSLLELSLALSAWKEYGPDRWALRCTPSSGNLHPTEGYLVTTGLAGLGDGLYHYRSRDHAVERRCILSWHEPLQRPRLWLGLSSIHWREAWKYGERAFRYCQLDVGHAIGALCYAAAALGWKLRMVEAADDRALAHLLGLDRTADYAGVEAEDAELLLQIEAGDSSNPAMPTATATDWQGKASLLDPHPMYHWPVIDEVADATTRSAVHAAEPWQAPQRSPLPTRDSPRAIDVIRGRRSAQHFDRNHTMSAGELFQLLARLVPAGQLPWDVWSFAPALDLVLFVHRVEGLAPGIYLLQRSADPAPLRAATNPEFQWQHAAGAPEQLPLYLLLPGDFRQISRVLNCRQAIGGDCCVSFAMLARFDAPVRADAWRYRQLHWEAGLIGHVLYLEAEGLGLRGTGIGCFFDDSLHELLGLHGTAFQTLYHFTVGKALTDERIRTDPPYPERT